MNDVLPPRVFLRPIGMPLPLGLAGLAIASFVESGLDLRWISTSETIHVSLVLLAVPALLQLLAAVFCYLARDGAAGTMFGILASTWLAQGLIRLHSHPGSVSGGLGLLLLAAGGVLLLTATTLVASKVVPALVGALAASRFIVAGIYELGSGRAWLHAAGIVGLVLSGLAAYAMLAFELEAQKKRAILPTVRRGRGAAATEGGAGAQVDGIAHEPGVRQTA